MNPLKTPPSLHTVLTIAGSDTIGGAGIQADLKTITAHGVYGMSVITALTAQNTLGVQAIHTPPAEFVRAQIDSVFADIRPDAIKIGMLANKEIIRTVAQALRDYDPDNIILDPVMISTSNHRLLDADAEEVLENELLPLVHLVTPNLPEAAALAHCAPITTGREMIHAAKTIACKHRIAVLLKGGHLDDCASDLFYLPSCIMEWFAGSHIDTENTHGTGCTLSSAIASNLALGKSPSRAIRDAKLYVTNALRHDPRLGKGNGPLNHMAGCTAYIPKE